MRSRSLRARRLLISVASFGVLLAWCRSGGSLRGRSWLARLDRYDYLESVEFGDGGKGEMVLGWNQTVRYEHRFRFEQRRGKVDLEFTDDDLAGEKRTVAYRLDRGDYRFETRTPAGPKLTRCRERVTFDASPFPNGESKSLAFYRDCTFGAPPGA